MSVTPLKTDRLTVYHLLVAAALAALGVLVTWDAWADLFTIAWRDEEYSHIFLVPLIAGWLVYVRRMRFRRLRHEGTWLGPLIVAAAWGLTWWGFNHGVQAFWHGGAVILAVGCIVCVLGRGAIFAFLPAVAVLAFMVPVPGQLRQKIAVPLQAGIAQIDQALLDLMRVETHVSGNSLIINGKPVMIAEACNGMRMVFPLILIAFAFAYGLPLRNGVRLLLLAASPVVAIVANVIRTVPEVWLFGAFQSGSDQWIPNVVHDYSGWAMLPLAFVVLLAIIRLMRWAAIPVNRYTLAGQ